MAGKESGLKEVNTFKEEDFKTCKHTPLASIVTPRSKGSLRQKGIKEGIKYTLVPGRPLCNKQ